MAGPGGLLNRQKPQTMEWMWSIQMQHWEARRNSSTFWRERQKCSASVAREQQSLLLWPRLKGIPPSLPLSSLPLYDLHFAVNPFFALLQISPRTVRTRTWFKDTCGSLLSGRPFDIFYSDFRCFRKKEFLQPPSPPPCSVGHARE